MCNKIAITEVTPKYCKTPVQECELKIDGFTTFHNLEAEKRGVLILVKDSLKPTKVEALSNSFQEALPIQEQRDIDSRPSVQ